MGPLPSSPTASPNGASRHKELGMSVSKKDIEEALSSLGRDDEYRAYWPIPGSSSIRMGECVGVENTSMDELFGLVPASSRPRGHGRPSMSISSFFGLKTDRCVASDCVSSSTADSTRWVPHPPYRFAVEFWDVESLREKSHLYSRTIWYAGSLFNVFVQMFRKKTQGPQLGVYLHRQSSVDPIPPLSVPAGQHPATETPTDNRPNARNLSSPSSATLLHTSQPSTLSLAFLCYPARVQTRQFRVHLRILLFLGAVYRPRGHQPLHTSLTVIPEHKSLHISPSRAPAQPVPP
jgi:hypothetical protein